jgi:hypothetical protein
MVENGKTTFRPKSNTSNDLAESAPKPLPAKPARPFLKTKNRGGAPKGNANAFKSGFYTGESKDLRRRVRAFRRHIDTVLAAVKAEHLNGHGAEKSAG